MRNDGRPNPLRSPLLFVKMPAESLLLYRSLTSNTAKVSLQNVNCLFRSCWTSYEDPLDLLADPVFWHYVRLHKRTEFLAVTFRLHVLGSVDLSVGSIYLLA